MVLVSEAVRLRDPRAHLERGDVYLLDELLARWVERVDRGQNLDELWQLPVSA